MVSFQESQYLFNLVTGVIVLVFFEQPNDCLLEDAHVLVGVSFEHLAKVLFVEAWFVLVVIVHPIVYQALQHLYVLLNVVRLLVFEHLRDAF